MTDTKPAPAADDLVARLREEIAMHVQLTVALGPEETISRIMDTIAGYTRAALTPKPVEPREAVEFDVARATKQVIARDFPELAKPLSVTPDDEALNVHRFSFDGRAIEVDGEYEFVKASEVRRRIAELQYAVAVWRGKAEMRGREGAQARAALAEVRDKTIEECAAIATARRNQWSCAGGFGGHSAGARIIQDEILALKTQEPNRG